MNMTKSAFLFVLLLFSVRAFGQTDTIFSNNEKIPCIVKEIKESSVVYVHPGEELLNSIYKNAVQKIVFKNGFRFLPRRLRSMRSRASTITKK